MYYLCSENKGADQLRGYREAALRLCFHICKSRFSHGEAHIIFFGFHQMDDSLNKEDKHISVIEKETGKVLSGEDAPLASQLEAWLEANPGYVIAFHLSHIM